MKTVTNHIDVHTQFQYDEKSPEFIQAFEDYKSLIDEGANIKDMIDHVHYNIINNGDEGMVEGVGYLAYKMDALDEDPTTYGEPFSGIYIVGDVDFGYNDQL